MTRVPAKFTTEDRERRAAGTIKRDQWEIPKSSNLPAIYTSEAAAYRLLFKQRWPAGVECIYCGQGDKVSEYYQKKSAVQFCQQCNIFFSLRTGRVYEKSKIPLNKWLYGIFLVKSAGMVNSNELSDRLNICKETAVLMRNKIIHYRSDEFGAPRDKAAEAAAAVAAIDTAAEKAAALKATRKKYRETNAAELKVKRAAWRAANPESRKAHNRKYYLSNKEEIKVKRDAWRAANPEAVKESRRRYQQKRKAARKAIRTAAKPAAARAAAKLSLARAEADDAHAKASAAAIARRDAKRAARYANNLKYRTSKRAAALAALDAAEAAKPAAIAEANASAAREAIAALAAHDAEKPNDNELCGNCRFEFSSTELNRHGDDWLCAECIQDV